MCLQIINLIYMYRQYSALNNLQWLICHKTKPNRNPKAHSKIKPNLNISGISWPSEVDITLNLIYMYKQYSALNNLQWLICHKTKPNQTKPKP